MTTGATTMKNTATMSVVRSATSRATMAVDASVGRRSGQTDEAVVVHRRTTQQVTSGRGPNRRAESESSMFLVAGREPGHHAWVRQADRPATSTVVEKQRGPRIPTSDEELAGIADAMAFLAMLRLVQVRSGRNPGQIALVTRIPRASVYALVKEDREHLPTKEDQVLKFLIACRLPEHQVRRLYEIWLILRDARPPRARYVYAADARGRVTEDGTVDEVDTAAEPETATDQGTVVGELDSPAHWPGVSGTLVSAVETAIYPVKATNSGGRREVGALNQQETVEVLSRELQEHLEVVVRDIAGTPSGFSAAMGRGARACLAIVVTSSLLMALLVIMRIIPEQSLMLAAAPNLVAGAVFSLGMQARKVLREEITHVKRRFTSRMSWMSMQNPRREPGRAIQPVGSAFDSFSSSIAM